MIINDGSGTGNQAKVDSNNRLFVKSVGNTEQEQATEVGISYNVNTGLITLTSANESAILYLKNTGLSSLHISDVAVGVGRAVGATSGEQIAVTIVRNPTGGTIVSGATAVDMNQNRNFGSANTLLADAYKGAEGDTITGGNDVALLFAFPSSRIFTDLDFYITPTQTIAIKIDPPANTTSLDCYAAFVLHVDEGI